MHDLPLSSTTFDLLSYYSLDPERYPRPLTKVKVLSQWLRTYSEQWVRWALIESLYQGRYKTYSVEQLLGLWQRRGQPLYHFSHEFESMICHNVPRPMAKAVSFELPLEEQPSMPTDVGTMDGDADHGSTPARVLLSATTASLETASEVDAEEMADEPAEGIEPASTEQVLSAKLTAVDRKPEAWVDPFSRSQPRSRPSVLDTVLYHHQLLPLTFGRIGLEPIHQFMPEGEPIEFCEKLAAIARTQA